MLLKNGQLEIQWINKPLFHQSMFVLTEFLSNETGTSQVDAEPKVQKAQSFQNMLRTSDFRRKMRILKLSHSAEKRKRGEGPFFCHRILRERSL